MVAIRPQVQQIQGLALVFWVGFFCLGFSDIATAVSTRGDLGSGIEYRRVDLRFGDLRGEVCNFSDRPVDELAVIFIAVDFQGRKLWHAVVDIAGLGTGRCQGVRRSPDDFSQPFRLSGTLVEFHRQSLLEAGNLNFPFLVRRLRVSNRRVTAQFCNRSGGELLDASVNLLGLSGHGEVVWRHNFPVAQLETGYCQDLSKELDTGRLARNVLFNVLPAAPPAPLQQGEIEPGLTYERLRVRVGRLRGEFCNGQKTETGELLIKVYALRESGSQAWSQSLYLPSISSGDCQAFSEPIIEQSIRPSAWRFRVARIPAAR